MAAEAQQTKILSAHRRFCVTAQNRDSLSPCAVYIHRSTWFRDGLEGLCLSAWMAAIAMILVACTTPTAKPYTLTSPIAQTGTQHMLLGQRIDINTADAATLEALPGVGASLAQAIVADRAHHGPFRSVSDLNRVRGIGDKLLTKLSPFISVSSKL